MAIRFDRKKRSGIEHRFANPLPTEEALNQTKLRAEESVEARMVMTSLQHLALSLEDTHETIQRVGYIGAIKKAGAPPFSGSVSLLESNGHKSLTDESHPPFGMAVQTTDILNVLPYKHPEDLDSFNDSMALRRTSDLT
ncbi:uncharacterized protein G6M90_00g055350 [Metarhizium brunneum]|uniref:Uncharacterized protein n=1 Tax=Metarhizium brunneum TaxID=500148 RepID=A0A7D5Z1Q3_9HYPO